MKTKPALLVLVAAMLAFAPHARAQADLYSTVTNLWWNGPKTNLLALAEQRLAADTNDIVGIVLKTEYDISFSRASVLSNSFRRVLSVGAGVRTPAFSAARRNSSHSPGSDFTVPLRSFVLTARCFGS